MTSSNALDDYKQKSDTPALVCQKARNLAKNYQLIKWTLAAFSGPSMQWSGVGAGNASLMPTLEGSDLNLSKHAGTALIAKSL